MDQNQQYEEQCKEFPDPVGIEKDRERDTKYSFSPSPFFENYLQIMKPSVPIEDSRLLDQLSAAGIQTTARHCEAEISILDFRFSSHYEVMELKVKLGRYILGINLINIQGSSPLHGSCFQEGNFGKLYKYRSHEGVLKAVKCLQILEPEMLEKQLLSVLLECCFLKMSSALKCGPKVQLGNFDIFLYLGNHENQRYEEKSCIEFQMELCESRQMTSDDYQVLMGSLYSLHRAGIVHNDIKPPNILFSKFFRKWVFLDYGVSLCPGEEPGYQTNTFFRGTLKYAGPQMRKLYPNQQGLVDLYWNDVASLQKCEKDTFLPAKQEEVGQEEDNSISEHFLVLQLKFNLYFSNVAEVIRLTASLKWNQKVKTILFQFFQQISYIPSDLKLHFERVTSWQEISSMESLDPSKMFGRITSDLDFKSPNLNLSPKISRKEMFKRVHAGVLGLKKDRLKNQYLKDIYSEKGKEKVMALLSQKEEVNNLQPSTHIQLLFEIVNFTESFSLDGRPVELLKKEKLCQIFEEVDRARTQGNHQKLLPQHLQSTLYFIKRALQEALECPEAPLGSILVPVYINYLMLGLAETKIIKAVYEVLPTLRLDVGKVCDAFYLVHLNSCWFQKSVKLANSIDLLEVRRSAVSSMEGIASKIEGYSSAHHCGELCEQREYDLLKLIYGCSDKAGHSYDSLQNRLKSCELVLSTLKHNTQMRGEVVPDNGTRYRSWEIPLTLPELLNEVILNLNSQTFVTTTRHIEELIDCPAITSSWLSSMLSEIMAHLEVTTQGRENCVVLMLRLYESYELPVPNSIFYLICYYNVRRYLLNFYFLFEAGTSKAEQLKLDCDAVIMLMGNTLSVSEIVDFLLNLPIEQSIAVWWYLGRIRKESERISMVIELYLKELSKGQCPSKKQLKGLQFNIFRHVFLEDWEELSEEDQMRVDTLVFGGEGGLRDNYLKLRYIEYSCYDCDEKVGPAISKNPRYQQVFSFLEGAFKNETKCWEYFITGRIRSYVFQYYLYYLLASNRNDTILWFLEEITSKMFRYYSRQINYSLFRMRFKIYNFFLFQYPIPPEGVRPLMAQMPFSQKTFQLMSIFLVFIDLTIFTYRSSIFKVRTQFPGASTQKLLYCSLKLHDKVSSNLKLLDIELFYRCLLMMSSLRGVEIKFKVDERVYNRICRNHKKIIEKLLSSAISGRQKKIELIFYARYYQIAICRRKDYYHPEQDDQLFIAKFKEMLNRYYFHQTKHNRFHIKTIYFKSRQQRREARPPKRMLPLFD